VSHNYRARKERVAIEENNLAEFQLASFQARYGRMYSSQADTFAHFHHFLSLVLNAQQAVAPI
jgi:hypothetical protein